MTKCLKWTNAQIQIVAQLSKVNVRNKYNQQVEQMYNEREEIINILSYVDFSKLCNIIKFFPESNQKFAKEVITFPILSSSISIEWKKNLNELE